VLRIRDVYPGPGSEFFHPGSRVERLRIRICNKEFKYLKNSSIFKSSVADHLDAARMGIRILIFIWCVLIRIRLFTLMRIRILILASKFRLKPLKKCSSRLVSHTIRFGLSSANWYGSGSSLSLWCRSRSRFLLDADPGSHNDAIRIHNTVFKPVKVFPSSQK
jgi:hypothetical protein